MDSVLIESIYSEQLYSVETRPVVVLNVAWGKVEGEERILLSKILAAIKLSLDYVVIKHQPTFDLSNWIQKPKQVIYFGDQVKGLSQYEVVEANGVSIVTSESLKDLLQNDVSRKKLWQALKKQFAV